MENGNGSIFCTLVELILVNKITDKNACASMNKQESKNEINNVICGEVQRAVDEDTAPQLS